MRAFLLLTCLWIITSSVRAQYTWCVSLNGNTRLKHVSENKAKNQVPVSSKDLNATGFFQVKFSRYDTAMRRTILVDDSTSSGIDSWEEVERSWQIKTSELKKLLETKGTLSFYYTEIPRDINKAMLVRIRPIHVCTVKRSYK